MLSDDAAIQQVIIDGNLLARANPNLAHIISSTISVSFSHQLTALNEEAGIAYVAAPVLGRPDVAARGELNVLAAGLPEALSRISDLALAKLCEEPEVLQTQLAAAPGKSALAPVSRQIQKIL